MVIAGKEYVQHRLAWLYMHGRWPSGDIDHINGNRSDNRFSNLRDVATQTNSENRRCAQKNNKAGLLGVTKRRNGYEARIRVLGRLIYLGLYDTPERAHEVFLQAKRERHAGCTI